MIMLQIGIGVAGFAGNILLFLAAVWIILPENKNPFDEGFWHAILRAAIFMGCMFGAILLIAFGVAVVPFLAFVVAPILFAAYCYAMASLYDSEWPQSLMVLLTWSAIPATAAWLLNG